MSNIILINTSGPTAQVSIILSGQVAAQRQLPSDRILGTRVLTAVSELLQEAQLTLADIDRVAVHQGPGHYSALRSGIVIGTMLVEATGAESVAVTGDAIEDLVKLSVQNEPISAIEPVYLS